MPAICLVLAAGGLHAADSEPPAATVLELRPAPPPALTHQRMREWHRGYRGWIAPVLKEWERLARVAHGRPGGRLIAGCRRLGVALGSLERDLPLAPDPSVTLHLERTLSSLSAAAEGCAHGAYFLTSWHLSEAGDSWRELRGRLQLYGLEP